MKSVVAEASSISKAIELAWQKASQPKEFLVKIFQEPQRNMFGLTKTSAKVGIFFDDSTITQKIKNAAQSSQPSVHNAKQISPITAIKPIDNRQQAAKPAKPQPKIETKPTETTSQVASSPVNKNTQTPKVNNNRRNNPNNRPVNKPEVNLDASTPNHPAKNTPTTSHKVDLPSEQSLVEQVISLIASEKNNKIANPVPSTTNTNHTNPTNGSTTPRTARNKYYHRRKPRSPRPNTPGNGMEQKPAAAPSNNKKED